MCQAGIWDRRPTGAQGSDVLRSTAEPNCFIVLEHERGSLAAGDLEQVRYASHSHTRLPA